jgi:16S rRNA (adenine1518-N6/adenine1519-N6)-dimethyltransferase
LLQSYFLRNDLNDSSLPLHPMTQVKAKKHLGQHFLKDENIAQQIVKSLSGKGYHKILEIGPGMGVLTKYLLQEKDFETYVIDIDRESISYLQQHFPVLEKNIISGDFLKLDLESLFPEPFAVIGNFPYNISSQILFKVLENRDKIPEVVGMFQKEVAERIAAPPGSKTYGILSVFMQAFYKIDYLFTVAPEVFNPPPKVQSAVILLSRNQRAALDCDEKMFFRVVKTAFNQRRKTLRNALKPLPLKEEFKNHEFLEKRAERLSVKDFTELTNMMEKF